uniref:phospholipase D n=1 Tax=Macrostomum lignano TaxID=282301 RepID=A0A1I8JRR5_9PLAT
MAASTANRQREQPRRNLAGSIWKLQKNADSKAAKRRLQKHVDTLGSQQSQRTNPWAWYGQLNTGYALKTDEAQKFQLFRGMDYINWMLSDPTVMDKPYTAPHQPQTPHSPRPALAALPQTPLTAICRAPPGTTSAALSAARRARDVARHFIERWNYSRNRCASSGEPVLLPKAANSGLSSAAAQPHQQPHQAEDSGAAFFAEPAAEAADASKVSMRPARRSRNRSNSDAGGGRQQRNRPSWRRRCGADEADTGGIGVVFNEVGRARHAAPGEGQALAGAATHCRVRILRSLGFWSGGLSVAESSILQAYHYVIGKAEHYLYIENQFFISCCLPSSHASRMQSQRDSTQVQNNLSWSLFRKIVEMHRLGRPFRVYLVIPVLRCMESGVLSPPVLMMLHHEYTSLFRGGASLFRPGCRSWTLIPPGTFQFAHSKLGRQPSGQLVTEQVYVHSKVIIADDSMCIIGSANINDRSLRGDCDSEVAGLFEDTGEDLRPEVWQSGRVRVGRFAGSLRRYLMREHLGITAAATAAAEAAAALSEASETAGTSAANADATRRDSETSGERSRTLGCC